MIRNRLAVDRRLHLFTRGIQANGTYKLREDECGEQAASSALHANIEAPRSFQPKSATKEAQILVDWMHQSPAGSVYWQ